LLLDKVVPESVFWWVGDDLCGEVTCIASEFLGCCQVKPALDTPLLVNSHEYIIRRR
jgi:hypothetical protein